MSEENFDDDRQGNVMGTVIVTGLVGLVGGAIGFAFSQEPDRFYTAAAVGAASATTTLFLLGLYLPDAPNPPYIAHRTEEEKRE